MNKKRITILHLILICLLNVSSQNKETVFIYNKDRFTKRVSKKLHYFILYDGAEYVLKKTRDSSNTVIYLIPNLPDSAIIKMKEDRAMNVRIKYKRQCFETRFFNVTQGNNHLKLEIKRNNFNRNHLVFLQVNGKKSWCPPVYPCGLVKTNE